MDTITQGLLGAATAQLGFRRKLGRGATWAAALTAMLPDLDIFAAPLMRAVGVEVGPFDSMRTHRGISHSLLFSPLLALATAGAWYALRRKQFGWLYLCCLAAAASHPLLDWCTSYGTQLLAPLSDRRFAADVVPIIDILYTPILIVTLMTCWLLRRFGPRAARAATRVGWGGFLLSVAYLAAGRVMHDVAVARGLDAYATVHPSAALDTPPPSVTAEAYPTIGSIFVWRVVVRAPDGWYVGRTHTLFDRPVKLTRRGSDDDPFVRAALADPNVQTFRWFTGGNLRAVSRVDDGQRIVELHDMRYGIRTDSPESLWYARVTLDDTGRVRAVQRRHNFRNRSRPLGRAARMAWQELFTP